MEERHTLLNQRGGYESPKTLELMIEVGATTIEVFRKMQDYGSGRWAFMHDAGISVKEMVRFMQTGYWNGADIHEIWDPALPEPIQTPWGNLYWAGYNLDELRQVGFRGEIDPENLTRLAEEQNHIALLRRTRWGY